MNHSELLQIAGDLSLILTVLTSIFYLAFFHFSRKREDRPFVCRAMRINSVVFWTALSAAIFACALGNVFDVSVMGAVFLGSYFQHSLFKKCLGMLPPNSE